MKEKTTIEYSKVITIPRDEVKALLRLTTKLDGEIDRCYWDATAKLLRVYCIKVEVHEREEEVT